MSLNLQFDIDFESDQVIIVYDDAIVLTVERLDDNTFHYINFHKLDDESIANKIKKFASSLLNIE